MSNSKKVAQNINKQSTKTHNFLCLKYTIHLLGGSWEKIYVQIAITSRKQDAERLSIFAGKSDLYRNRFQ